jgi:hypothetical protein
VQRRHYPWVLIGIELIAFASGIVTGVLVSIVLAAIYLVSLRTHPRARDRHCGGTGEYRGRIFTWVHHKCPHCPNGRIIRWGAGLWGADHIRREYRRTRDSLRAARDQHRWR